MKAAAFAACAFIVIGGAAPKDSESDQALVTSGLGYLDGLTNAQGRFVQIGPRGQESQGEVFLRRPGRARFQYDPPSDLVVVSDGHSVLVLDPRLKSFRSYPLGMTPLGPLLSRRVRLGRETTISAVRRTARGFEIAARQRKAGKAALVLDFSARPIALIGWTVISPQGQATRVRLLDFKASGPLPSSLFELRDPEALPKPSRNRTFGLPD
ncbi:MAG: LolA family protein [Caulobacteraceae bacterium]